MRKHSTINTVLLTKEISHEDTGHTTKLVFDFEKLLRRLLAVDATNGPECWLSLSVQV